MLIVGAKGFAKEVLETIQQLNLHNDLVFYDDVNADAPEKLFGQFPVLKSLNQAENYFINQDTKFTVGIGNPLLRKKLSSIFNSIGGVFTTTICPKAIIGTYDVQIGIGSNILSGAVLSNSVILGKGCIVYYNSILTHDCIIGDFVEISPAASILGRSHIGSYSQIGSNATILPDVKIGENVIIGAGAVVTKDVPDNCVAVGIPAKIIKALKPLDL